MNRKKAIKRLFLLGGGAVLAYAGIKGYQLYKHPDLEKLDDYKELVDELAEVIIPETDTPGAKKAGVGSLILVMVKDCSTRQAQNNFIAGLEDLAAYSQSEYNKPFVKCSPDQQASILSHFEKKGKGYGGMVGKIEKKIAGESFFATLKKYTVLGYCTSQLGATQGLRYDFVPGKYIGTDLLPGDKAWATR
jgi:hypothetical protein